MDINKINLLYVVIVMVVTKIWLSKQLDDSKNKAKELEEKKDFDRGNIELGKIQAFELVFEKLTEAPDKKITKKTFDADKGYEAIVRYYVDKKGYSVERANKIAQQTVSDQQARLT